MMGNECYILVGPRKVCNHPTSVATIGEAWWTCCAACTFMLWL
jgi:hypothetical protein